MNRSALLVSLLTLLPSVALAGGFEMPDNNAEALGRGAAFTAKADDASAMEYNIAGFARQRGTRTLLSANIVFNNYSFTRAGNYPGDPADPNTPYAGQPYPTVSNQGAPFFAPFFGISTDFNYFDRWTFAIGAFGPSSYGQRQFPVTVTLPNGMNAPSPSRYDFVSENLLIVYPTLAAAVRVTKWLDLGLALHLVVGSFDLSSIALVDLGRSICKTGEYAPCDSQTTLNLTGVTATAALGIMLHPTNAFHIGINLRGPVYLDASGTANGTPPAVQQGLSIAPAPAEFHTQLPWVLRAGARYGFLANDGFETGDVEVDGTYEAWSAAQSQGQCFGPMASNANCMGAQVNIPSLSIFSDINPTVVHNFRDTFSVRVGGAYNLRLSAGVLTFRLGFFFDSAASHYADTRLDFDTMAKYAPTAGLGFKIRGIGINLAYAYLFSPDRTVTNGDIHVINAVTNGSNIGSTPDMAPLPAVNNGTYSANNQIVSISINLAWDEALKKHRTLNYE